MLPSLLGQALCIETQRQLNEDAVRHEKRDAELKELQELCIQTQARLNEDTERQHRRDTELAELKQLCIDTQRNLNDQAMTTDGKDAELAELRELCIQTQAKLCEDAGTEDALRAQLAKKDAEVQELMQLCIETQRKLNEEAAEEGTPPGSAAAKASGDQDRMLRMRAIEALVEVDSGRSMLTKAMVTAKKGKTVDAEMLGKIWAEADTNGDGKLSLDEVVPLVKAVMLSMKPDLAAAKAEARAEMESQAAADPMQAMMLGMALPMLEMAFAAMDSDLERQLASPDEAAKEFMAEVRLTRTRARTHTHTLMTL